MLATWKRNLDAALLTPLWEELDRRLFLRGPDGVDLFCPWGRSHPFVVPGALRRKLVGVFWRSALLFFGLEAMFLLYSEAADLPVLVEALVVVAIWIVGCALTFAWMARGLDRASGIAIDTSTYVHELWTCTSIVESRIAAVLMIVWVIFIVAAVLACRLHLA